MQFRQRARVKSEDHGRPTFDNQFYTSGLARTLAYNLQHWIYPVSVLFFYFSLRRLPYLACRTEPTDFPSDFSLNQLLAMFLLESLSSVHFALYKLWILRSVALVIYSRVGEGSQVPFTMDYIVWKILFQTWTYFMFPMSPINCWYSNWTHQIFLSNLTFVSLKIQNRIWSFWIKFEGRKKPVVFSPVSSKTSIQLILTKKFLIPVCQIKIN